MNSIWGGFSLFSQFCILMNGGMEGEGEKISSLNWTRLVESVSAFPQTWTRQPHSVASPFPVVRFTSQSHIGFSRNTLLPRYVSLCHFRR